MSSRWPKRKVHLKGRSFREGGGDSRSSAHSRHKLEIHIPAARSENNYFSAELPDCKRGACSDGVSLPTCRGVWPNESLRGRVSDTGWSGGSSVMIMFSTLACRPACNRTPLASYITCTPTPLIAPWHALKSLCSYLRGTKKGGGKVLPGQFPVQAGMPMPLHLQR